MGGVAVVNGLFRPNGVALLGILSLGHARFVGPSATNGFFAIFLFLSLFNRSLLSPPLGSLCAFFRDCMFHKFFW